MPVGNETNHRFDGLTVEGGLAVGGSSSPAYLAASSTSELLVNGVGTSPRVLITSVNAFFPSSKNHATSTYVVVGIDTTAGVVYVSDTTNGVLKISEDWGATFSGSKGYPSGVVGASGVAGIVRFGSSIYTQYVDSGSSIVKVAKATPTSGNNALSWSAVLTATANTTTTIPPSLCAGSQYLFFGEYSDPTGGPTIWRSSDGTTWTASYGPDPAMRHIHAVAEDPYNPGHIWATVGDGVFPTILKSTNHGASWSAAVASPNWQAVQISFSREFVWFAHDSRQCTASVLDRVTNTSYVACPNHHYNVAVPGAAASTDRFYQNAYFGAVDPATGVYYCTANDTSVAGNSRGLFFVPRVGEPVQLMDSQAIMGMVFIANGKVWAGNFSHPVVTLR